MKMTNEEAILRIKDHMLHAYTNDGDDFESWVVDLCPACRNDIGGEINIDKLSEFRKD